MKAFELIEKAFWEDLLASFDLGEYSEEFVIEYSAIGMNLDAQMGTAFFEAEHHEPDVKISSSSAKLKTITDSNQATLVEYAFDDDDLMLAFVQPLMPESEVFWKRKSDHQYHEITAFDRMALIAAQIVLNQAAASIVASELKEMGEF
ncbi:hypothetical protein [Iodobacter fluviatilis]|uniref:Uncharacterized protein n=1 Tax=Iodobacter fluviatilis TaxID=537 RepID=A0A377Q4H3_9NEIS|nr:hypothetical protein [Iodobacter fluviatilis]TCU90593.1 hypothetical protein EV682_101633 [Iodobacter fluviatilis]STQ89620.1 Uncharacterised protein [Iodobacter fluviatilis]